jgi:hypothetical protein
MIKDVLVHLGGSPEDECFRRDYAPLTSGRAHDDCPRRDSASD